MKEATEAHKLALAVLVAKDTCGSSIREAKEKAIIAITKALAQPDYRAVKTYHEGKPVYVSQPEQEPVAWMNDSTPSGIFARHIDGARNFGCTLSVYTTPPKRPWVGLTDEEAEWCQAPSSKETWKRMETKLKEKNAP